MEQKTKSSLVLLNVILRHSNMTSMYLIVTALVLVGCSIGLADDTYTNKYDNIDVDAILRSDRLLRSYIACILELGPCTPEGRTFREILPDALSTNCAKCTTTQKGIVRKVSTNLQTRHPEDWAKFVEKYDPEGQYITSFATFLKE